MFAILLSEDMDPFYQNISSFPTAFFTFVLAVIVLYWLVAVLGMVDIDILDFDINDPTGELGVNTQTEHGTPDVLAGLMLKLGLHGVPITIILSFIALFGWLCCYYLVYLLFPLVPDGVLQYLVGLPILLGALFIASMMTSVVIKPLRPLFKKATAHTPKVILGQTAVVRTSRVDNNFGEAMLDDGGAGIILKVRTSDETTFKKGDRVVLLEYEKENNIYYVITEEEFLN
ncbi:DUF1449 domain-containing protein [Pseudomonadota bacterium]